MPTMSFPGRFESLVRISEFVSKAAQDAGLDKSAIYAVKLAVDEACSNIIEHGYGGEGLGEIDCTCDITNDGLTITIRDWGESFDPSEIGDPITNVPLQDLKPRGLGLFFMRKMMDDVSFEFHPNNGNVLTMVKYK
jgi:serine/threonine-protein kinase RsbW